MAKSVHKAVADDTIKEMVLMLSTQRKALNNLLPTSQLDMDQPSATNEAEGRKNAAEEQLSRSQRRNKREANTKECETKQGI